MHVSASLTLVHRKPAAEIVGKSQASMQAFHKSWSTRGQDTLLCASDSDQSLETRVVRFSSNGRELLQIREGTLVISQQAVH